MIEKQTQKTMLFIIYVMVLFLDRMDLTLTNVAMPTFARAFHISVTRTDWIATSFLIALGVSMPLSGWLTQKYGAKNIFIGSNILFTLSSTLCAFSWSFSSLIFFRIFQGFGGGLLIPVGMSLVYQAYEVKDYPKLANYTLIPTLVAPSIAPAIGGLLLKYYTWHWIFFIHFPIGLISILLSFIFLEKNSEKTQTPKFDWKGFCLLSFGLTSLFYFLSQLGLYGLSSFLCQVSGICTLIFISLFIYVEKKVQFPLLDFNFFKIKLFTLSVTLQVLMQICYFGSLFIIALYFQFCLGMSALVSGLSMTGQSVGTICMLFFSSRLFRKFGPKYFMISGFLFLSVMTLCILLVHNPNEILLANAILWLRGMSIGLVNGPLQACAMLDLTKNQTSKGSSIFNVFRQIGISLGVALSCSILAFKFRVGSLLEHPFGAHLHTLSAFKLAFWFLSAVALIASAVSFKFNNDNILKKLHHVR